MTIQDLLSKRVTSRRDVWIETTKDRHMSLANYHVTSRRDVWIETIGVIDLELQLRSHPVGMCGLKLPSMYDFMFLKTSHPVGMCGLKL